MNTCGLATSAVLIKANESLELRGIAWGCPNYGAVWVKIISAGICGAQLQEIRGEKGTHFPRLLGHEGVGIVQAIGIGVTKVAVGQKVICHWRKGDGIESPSPNWWFRDSVDMANYTAGQVTTFSTMSAISENRLTVVPDETPNDLCCLLGCGLSTALATIEQEAKLLIGESILIIGCGGLGLNLILAAKLRGASKIVVRESQESKHSLALTMGADSVHVCRPDERFDVVIDTSGDALAIGYSLHENLAPSGRFILVGQPKPKQAVYLADARHLFDGQGKSITATQGGGFNPSTDVKRYVDAYNAGRFNVDGIISHRYPLEKINDALDCVRAGQAGRILIEM